MTELETLQARVEQLAHELAESRKAEMDAVMALADIREACGDNGRRMQPDLVEYVRDLYLLSVKKEACDSSKNITKDGILVEAGQLWKDLDKRMGGRVCQVTSVNYGKAKMRRYVKGYGLGSSETTVSVRRMHHGSTGWERIK